MMSPSELGPAAAAGSEGTLLEPITPRRNGRDTVRAGKLAKRSGRLHPRLPTGTARKTTILWALPGEEPSGHAPRYPAMGARQEKSRSPAQPLIAAILPGQRSEQSSGSNRMYPEVRCLPSQAVFLCGYDDDPAHRRRLRPSGRRGSPLLHIRANIDRQLRWRQPGRSHAIRRRMSRFRDCRPLMDRVNVCTGPGAWPASLAVLSTSGLCLCP